MIGTVFRIFIIDSEFDVGSTCIDRCITVTRTRIGDGFNKKVNDRIGRLKLSRSGADTVASHGFRKRHDGDLFPIHRNINGRQRRRQCNTKGIGFHSMVGAACIDLPNPGGFAEVGNAGCVITPLAGRLFWSQATDIAKTVDTFRSRRRIVDAARLSDEDIFATWTIFIIPDQLTDTGNIQATDITADAAAKIGIHSR